MSSLPLVDDEDEQLRAEIRQLRKKTDALEKQNEQLAEENAVLSQPALRLLSKFQNSLCSYDDEDIFIEYLWSIFATGNFFPLEGKELRRELEGRGINQRKLASIRADTEFQTKFKACYLNASNLERNAMCRHMERIWLDWQQNIKRF